jgi:single-strand DNA-binding protein
MSMTLDLAVQRRFVDKQTGKRESDFFTVLCWGKLAEFVSKYMTKGRKAAVEGSVQMRSYDASDGSKRYVTEVIADNVEFCDSKSEGAQSGAQAAQGGFAEVDDEELPF